MRHPRELLLFEHIHKTAGSTMHAVLWRVYGGKAVFMTTVPGQHRDRLDVLRQRLRDPATPLRAVITHAGFGLHTLLPEGYRCRHFTFLRDPVERVISHYYFQKQRDKLDPSATLEDFVRSDLSRACNVQTAFLGGLELRRNMEGLALSPACYTEDLLRQAKANLRRMDAFGLTERFDESLLVLQRVFGWKGSRIFYARRRVGRLRPPEPPPERTLAVIRQYNALDLELYRYAQERFAHQLAEQFPGGGPDVKTFQRLNAAFNVVYPLARPVVHAARAVKKQWSSR